MANGLRFNEFSQTTLNAGSRKFFLTWMMWCSNMMIRRLYRLSILMLVRGKRKYRFLVVILACWMLTADCCWMRWEYQSINYYPLLDQFRLWNILKTNTNNNPADVFLPWIQNDEISFFKLQHAFYFVQSQNNQTCDSTYSSSTLEWVVMHEWRNHFAIGSLLVIQIWRIFLVVHWW
jgi:hypothetical protein